jgi:GTP-binding protein
MKAPVVAICGRPNVGKSTLFNRITRGRAALVHDLPGMTRDRSYGRVACLDDLGEATEVFDLIDTGGLDFEGTDAMTVGITRMAERALEEAHVILLMVDGQAGFTTGDAEIAQRALRLGKPAILVVNKSDGMKGGAPDGAFYELGLAEMHVVSSAHGDGVGDLLEAIGRLLPFHRTPKEAGEHDKSDELRFAIIGRPNVGKSSLTNCLLGYERSLVSEIAGTTRDAVDTIFRRGERVYRLIDTAGIRRKGKTTEGAEILSVMKAKQAMARADVSLLLLDTLEGATHQDAVIAGYAQEAGAAVVLVANKWDAVEKDGYTAIKIEGRIRQELGFLRHAPMIFVSALTGQRVSKLFGLIDAVAASHSLRIPTGELNRFLGESVAAMAPPAVDGRLPKLMIMTQVGTRPPSFVIKSNTSGDMHFSYIRYLENRLREAYGFQGAPIRISVQKARKGGDPPTEGARVRKILDVREGLKPGQRRRKPRKDRP